MKAIDRLKVAMNRRKKKDTTTDTQHGVLQIRDIRTVRGMSIASLSDATGICQSYLSQVERSVVNPTVSILSRIAQALGVTIKDLFV